VRWAALARLADAVDGFETGGGAQYLLRSSLGLPRAADAELGRVGLKARERALADNVWNEPGVFPEYLLTGILRSDAARHFVRRSIASEYALCEPFFRLLLEAARKDKSGAALEQLAAYLATLLPGCRPRVGVLAEDYAYENDVVVSEVTPGDFPIPNVGGAVLMECKNWEDEKMRSPHVGYFFTRMQLIGCRLGVLISRQGVTNMARGNDRADEKAAKAIIRRVYHQTGAVCLVVTDADLETICESGSFRSLIDAKYDEFVHGIAKRVE
jgi:hypothetical protein